MLKRRIRNSAAFALREGKPLSLELKIRKKLGKFDLNVELTAEREVVGLLGASGCGKSMTLRCIAGIVTPDEGRIVLDGVTLFDSQKKINLKPQERQVGLLFQNYALFPNMTVLQNIRTGLAREKDPAVREKAVYQVMEKLYLTGLEKHFPAQLSGGQQQRVALARILVSRPGILMLDEPFSALDSYLRWELELELRKLLDEFPGPTLLVSHDRDEVYRLCDRVCVLSKGKSDPAEPVKELFANPGSLAAALLSGCKNTSPARRLSDHELYAEEWGIRLRSARVIPENLKYVGIRAKDLRISGGSPAGNVVKCRVDRVTEEPFYSIYTLIPETEEKIPAKRWIRMDVEKHQSFRPEGDWVEIEITEENLLLLTS